jgi:hypothetical protein
MCKGHKFMCEYITKCYGMGLEGRGVTMLVQHKAERGPNAEGWDLTLVIDCTKEQHERLQQLIGHQLAEDRLMNRSDLGKDVESRARWDLGVYLSEIDKLDAKPSTKQRNKYALNLKNEDGLDSKWEHATNKLVDDGSGKGTKVRACVKGSNTLVDDGSGKGTKVRACVKAGMTKCALANCITCKMVPRKQHSDKCNSCQLAVFFSTYQ